MTNDISDPPSEPGANNVEATALGFKIINWIGIIEQLSATRMRQILAGGDLPPPQFVLLNHFSHRPEEGKTVSQIAWAMQQPQPGITKTVSKLIKKGYLKDRPNPEDGRSKILSLTKAGIKAHMAARNQLIAGMGDTFENWNMQDMKFLFCHLDRLKNHLDGGRTDIS